MIKKGDLVMVVRPISCCGSTKRLGEVFVAGDYWAGHAFCTVCGHDRTQYGPFIVVPGGNRCMEASRLTKIDPPPITQDVNEEAVA